MRHITIRHQETGQQILVDTYMSRYRRLALGFLNSLRLDSKFLKHIILTQDVEHYKPNVINNFLNSMRRYYGKHLYIWSTEVQEKRAARYGDRVLHWHIIFGFRKGYKFGREDVFRIQKYWKYGDPRFSVRISPVTRVTLSYLMKYITKSLSVVSEEFYQMRRMGSSMIAGWLRQSWNNVTRAISYFYSLGVPVESMGHYWWIRGNAYVKDDSGHNHCVFRRPKTPWYVIDKLEGDNPF